jgi:hypothetical protein
MRFIAEEVVPPLADELGVPFHFKPGGLVDTRNLSGAEFEALLAHRCRDPYTARDAVAVGRAGIGMDPRETFPRLTTRRRQVSPKTQLWTRASSTHVPQRTRAGLAGHGKH